MPVEMNVLVQLGILDPMVKYAAEVEARTRGRFMQKVPRETVSHLSRGVIF